jgi:hypothetical protein
MESGAARVLPRSDAVSVDMQLLTYRSVLCLHFQVQVVIDCLTASIKALRYFETSELHTQYQNITSQKRLIIRLQKTKPILYIIHVNAGFRD